MGAIKTNLTADAFQDKAQLREILETIKQRIPVGEGNRRNKPLEEWTGFDAWRDACRAEGCDTEPAWWKSDNHKLDVHNLGTLGGGNHFIELQKDDSNTVWLMLHSGSRNMGQRVATYYHKEAQKLNAAMNVQLPDENLAFLPADDEIGRAYIRDMNHALDYAKENRRLMMEVLKGIMLEYFPGIQFVYETNIHHNYAALETHNGSQYWIHRKGATSARKGETGIIPGSMGTSSYIVEGLGSEESFLSCSHGAGRRLGRSQANNTLTLEECEAAMGDVVYDRFHLARSKRRGTDGKKLHDLSEAPLAYKNINRVIEDESDLVKPIVRLEPLMVVKG
jgi:tRNA-splicing ligase RtcB